VVLKEAELKAIHRHKKTRKYKILIEWREKKENTSNHKKRDHKLSECVAVWPVAGSKRAMWSLYHPSPRSGGEENGKKKAKKLMG